MSVGLAIMIYPKKLPSLPETTIRNKAPLFKPTPHAHPQLPLAADVKYPFELLPTPQAQVQLPATSRVQQPAALLPTQQVAASARVSLVSQPHAQVPVFAGVHSKKLFLAVPRTSALIPASTAVRPAVQAPLLVGGQHPGLPGLVSSDASHKQAQISASTHVRPALRAALLPGVHHRGLVSSHIHVPVADIDQKYAATGKFPVQHYI
jgi:hypothetical protein